MATKDVTVRLRVSAREHEDWTAAAAGAGMSLSAWMRQVLGLSLSTRVVVDEPLPAPPPSVERAGPHPIVTAVTKDGTGIRLQLPHAPGGSGKKSYAPDMKPEPKEKKRR